MENDNDLLSRWVIVNCVHHYQIKYQQCTCKVAKSVGALRLYDIAAVIQTQLTFPFERYFCLRYHFGNRDPCIILFVYKSHFLTDFGRIPLFWTILVLFDDTGVVHARGIIRTINQFKI